MERGNQFKKGFDNRRNTKGRPKGSRNFKTVMAEATAKINRENPQSRDIESSIIRTLLLKALKGDPQCMKLYFEYMYGKPTVHKETEVIESAKPDVDGMLNFMKGLAKAKKRKISINQA